jgi:acetyl-CoA carboxylase carboxyl transferase subunit alpha
VISPEGCASILWRDGARAKDAAEAMKITAQDLVALKIVDRIVEEPDGGAHSDPQAAITAVGDAVEDELRKLSNLSPDELRRQRADRFYAIGRAGLA